MLLKLPVQHGILIPQPSYYIHESCSIRSPCLNCSVTLSLYFRKKKCSPGCLGYPLELLHRACVQDHVETWRSVSREAKALRMLLRQRWLAGESNSGALDLTIEVCPQPLPNPTLTVSLVQSVLAQQRVLNSCRQQRQHLG